MEPLVVQVVDQPLGLRDGGLTSQFLEGWGDVVGWQERKGQELSNEAVHSCPSLVCLGQSALLDMPPNRLGPVKDTALKVPLLKISSDD